ncbi:hypothetical protein PENSPDRAFT_646678, partial [Peniophora sp. CONT]
MPFQTRNAYYLRISSNTVLPLYVYLDERHVDWMTDRVLQHVLEDLRPKIPVKLRAEDHINLSSGSSGSAKKGTVDVHRGDTYQFAFFFKYTEPHSLLIKQRNFTLVTEPPPPPPQPAETKSSGRRKKTGSKKRATSSTTKGSNKRRRQARVDSDEEDIAIDISDDEDPNKDAAITSGPRRSSRRAPTRSYHEPEDDEEQAEPGPNAADASENDDVEMQDEYAPHGDSATGSSLNEPIVKEEADDTSLRFTPAPGDDAEMDTGAAQQMTFDVDEEEPKPKLAVQLKYQGFNITGRCLCVVVEPWPPVRSASRAPSAAPGRAASVRASATPAPSRPEQRQKTPLFLPDYDEDEERNRSVTPVPKDVRMRFSRPPVPLFDDPPLGDDDENDEEDEEGMMQFSQVLNSRSAFARGGTEEDDEFDGAVLFADADETREL